jgi:hypothetical protein
VTDPTPEYWTACRPGELRRLTARLAFRTKLRIAAQAAAATLAIAGVAAGGWYTYEVLAGPDCGRDTKPGSCGSATPPHCVEPPGPETPPTGAK